MEVFGDPWVLILCSQGAVHCQTTISLALPCPASFGGSKGPTKPARLWLYKPIKVYSPRYSKHACILKAGFCIYSTLLCTPNKFIQPKQNLNDIAMLGTCLILSISPPVLPLNLALIHIFMRRWNMSCNDILLWKMVLYGLWISCCFDVIRQHKGPRD